MSRIQVFLDPWLKGRVKNILAKLGANDRTHAAMIGVRRGIIQPVDSNE